ncbi:MAG TPA: hypothetical protein VLD13_10735 [Gaiellaceae bacterium]|nr:hypothetical protein [Gaiellaceae bacterium]
MRALGILQWVGLLAGAALWAAAHVVGYGITEARCGPAGAGWGIDLDLWEGLATGIAAVLVAGGGAAALAVVLGTAESSYESPPPVGRMRFFAIAALVANALFLVMIVLYAVGTIASVPCRQS